MAARDSMTYLIAAVRLLIGDPAGADAQFTDDELQAFLDARCVRRHYLRLKPLYETAPDGSRQARRFTSAPLGHWETDAVLVDASYTALEPASIDWAAGVFEFAEPPRQPVRITGRTHDPAGAAADALETWAARLKTGFDVRMGDMDFARMQRVEAILKAADRLRRRQKAVSRPLDGAAPC